MARYPRREIEKLSQVDEVTLARFERLTPTQQWQIIDLRHEGTQDAKLAQQDRTIAQERERQFRAVAKMRPKRRSG